MIIDSHATLRFFIGIIFVSAMISVIFMKLLLVLLLFLLLLFTLQIVFNFVFVLHVLINDLLIVITVNPLTSLPLPVSLILL